MPEVRMRAMTAEEFTDWRAPQVLEYAGDMARNTGRPTKDFVAQSEQELERLLPQGIQTPGHRLLFAEDVATGEQVGWLWLGERDVDGSKIAWIYDITVNEPLRGKGYGRAFMAEAEVQSRDMGLARIALNVFGDNETARRLYERSGYHETARQMAKDL